LGTINPGAALYFALPYSADMIGGGEVERALALAVLVAGGAALFAVLAQVTGAARLSDVKSLYKGKAAS